MTNIEDMLIKGADIIGRKILSEKENAELGTIKDLVYDPDQNKVVAFLVHEGGTIVEPKVIPFQEIKNITKSIVLAKSKKSLKPGSKVLKPVPNAEKSDSVMLGTNIVTEQGKILGTERDIVFDSKSGEVKEYEVVNNGTKERVQVEKVITSTNNTTVVKKPDPKSSSQENIVDKVKSVFSK